MKKDKVVYYNMKRLDGFGGVETVDCIYRSEHPDLTDREFNKEVMRVLRETRMAGMDVYLSRRCTNDWKNK